MQDVDIIKNAKAKTFLDSCVILSNELKRFEVDIVPFTESCEDRFNLVREQVPNISTYLLNEAQRLSTIEDTRVTDESESQNLWSYLKNNKFRFSNELFNRVDKDHILEIYDSKFRALYRNVNFYKATSYSIAELHLYSWPELFEREEETTVKVGTKVAEAFDSNVDEMIEFNIGNHDAIEKFSDEMLVAKMFFDFAAPIQREDGAKAVITTLKIKSLVSKLV